MDGIPWELDEMLMSQPGTPRPPATPTVGGSSRRLKGVPRSASSDAGSTHTMERGMLPPLLKLHGRKYAASLTSLLRRRESSDETRSMDVVPETSTSSLGRGARLKRFVKGLFKT